MGLFGKIFKNSTPDYNQWLSEGGVIVDVRTPAEFKAGHIKGSKNIPLDQIAKNAHKLDQNKPVILCCKSGMRSAAGSRTFKQLGFIKVHNGGGWMNLQNKLN